MNRDSSQSFNQQKKKPARNQSVDLSSNIYSIATKIKDTFEIGQILKNIIEGKF